MFLFAHPYLFLETSSLHCRLDGRVVDFRMPSWSLAPIFLFTSPPSLPSYSLSVKTTLFDIEDKYTKDKPKNKELSEKKLIPSLE